ncbi:unnamed protein product, partial [Candidula unifasciata]
EDNYKMISTKFILAIACLFTSVMCEDSYHELEAKVFLKNYDNEAWELFHQYKLAQWQIKTNNSLENELQL